MSTINTMYQANQLQSMLSTSSKSNMAAANMIGQGLMTKNEDLLAQLEGTVKGRKVGGGLGAVLGGIAGAIIGSIIPGAGTAAGAMLGSSIGGFLGGAVGRSIGGHIGGQHALHEAQQRHQ